MSEYLDGNLTGSNLAKFDIHISECKHCAEELYEMDNMISTLGLLSVSKSPVDCWAAVSERICEERIVAPTVKWWFLRPIVTAPAVALALLITILMIWPSQIVQEKQMKMTSVAEYQHYIGAHARLQRQHPFTDPDITFINAEYDNKSIYRYSTRP